MEYHEQLMHWLETRILLAAMAVFVALLIVVYWPRNKKKIERHGLIPLNEDH